MRTLVQDIRYGSRMLLRKPGLTIVAVMTLTLGIGAGTVIFSVVDHVLLRPLPFPDSDRIFTIWNTYPQTPWGEEEVSPPDFCDWREQNNFFNQLAAYERFSYVWTDSSDPVRLRAARVSGDFFSAMGINPILGRPILPADDHEGAHHVVVLSHELWRNQFGSDPSIVGHALTLNGVGFTVLGVMPAEFGFPGDVDLWSPLAYEPPFEPALRRSTWLKTVARLKPGVTPDEAQADMSTIASRLEREHPESNAGRGVRLVSLFEKTVGSARPALLVLLAAVGCLLMIACANVANLLLARASGRQKEIAVRKALGAGRLRLIRQLVTESVLLSLLGGAGGALVAVWALELVRNLNPAIIPRIQEVQLDFRVFGFMLLVSLSAGVVAGMAPALMAARVDFFEGIRQFGSSQENPRGRRFRSSLIVAEVAMAQILLVGGGLLFQSFLLLRSVDPGFNPESLLVSRFDLFTERYNDLEARRSFYRQAVERVSALPGVQAASLTTTIPLHEVQLGNEFVVEGLPRPPPSQIPSAGFNAITPDYFQTMGIRLLAGRTFSDADREGKPKTVIINQTMAEHFWPDESPMGQRIRLVSDESLADSSSIEIVGVVGDVRQMGLDAEVRSEIYLPYAQRPWRSCFLLVRSKSEPAGLTSAIRSEIRGIDPAIALNRFRSMNDYVSDSTGQPRFRTFLLGLFAALALILAVMGVFGVISYSVSQRTRDFGIRVALGAKPRDIFGLVLGRGFLIVLAGIVLGLVGSLALTRFMSSLLFGITPYDASTFVWVALACGAAAFAACYFPSRRAMKVDPITVLRSE